MAANRHFGMGKETTWGTPVAPEAFLELLSESLKVEKEWESIGTLRGYSVSQIAELSSIVRGDTEFLANMQGMVRLYWALIGSVSYATTIHTFPDAAAGIGSADRVGNSWTLEVRRGDVVQTSKELTWRYAGCKPISLGLSFAPDAASRITAGWVGKSEAKEITPASSSFPALEPFRPKDVTITVGGREVCARSFDLNIENPVDETFCLGGVGLTQEPDRSDYLKVTGSCEVLFDSYAEYDTFNGTAGASSEVAIVAAVDDATSSHTFTMAKAQITQATPAISGRDVLAATYEFESFYNDANTENIVIAVDSSDTDLTTP